MTNLDNSKRLYELSNWGYTPCSYQDTGTEQFSNYELIREAFNDKHSGSGGFPAYTLEYLLDKMPRRRSGQANAFILRQGTVNWEASLSISCIGYADNPTDAVALLCIKLFESGVLKK